MAAKADNRIKVDAAEHRAAGVEYSAIEGASGLFFACQPYGAKLSTTACASRWRSAQRARGEAAELYARCQGCPTGAQHAGERHFVRSSNYGNEICPRCGSGSLRMVGGRLCVSCHNRQWELKRGHNSKGTRPTIFLAERRIGVVIDFDDPGERRRFDVIDEFTLDLVEVMTQILRVSVGRVAFTAPSYGETVTMKEFTRFMVARLPARPARRRLLGAARGRRPS